jgi:NADPH:quinone reductase-like Zn-dependent oxidoreductase
MTAAIGLYKRLSLPLPSSNPEPVDSWILINGASSSVGSYAVQLAKLSGLKVLGIAGASKEYAKQVGADEVLDYQSLSKDHLASQIASKSIAHVFDAISTPESQAMIAEALQLNGGGELAVVLVPQKLGFDKVNVEPMVRVATAYQHNREFATEWFAKFGVWLTEGILKPNVAQIMPHGLVCSIARVC